MSIDCVLALCGIYCMPCLIKFSQPLILQMNPRMLREEKKLAPDHHDKLSNLPKANVRTQTQVSPS